ncbi:MAG: 2-C-methyl-D-erythritol 2,4-cyclodiphosphate synthase [Bacilli bacterium]|nr:2-C-methyl-D-erythritol 2,4-cyclodiphosphate synthase [Bacilli bacterium]
MEYRVGFSKDIHRLVEERKLIIAGVVVPFEKGELAHSDGDVVYHAIAESILGALALGDLGKHFPDTSEETKDMDSTLIVKHVISLMEEKGFSVNNIDVFVSLEKPKLKNYIEQMRANIASLLKVDASLVSLKAGTNEGCGEVGRGEAIEASSIVMLKK